MQNAQHLYYEIKEALRFFDLKFSEMNLMEVSFSEHSVVFSYEGRSITIGF